MILVSKPLPLLILISMVFIANLNNEKAYSRKILYGLVASLIGNIFFLFPGEYFISGLVSFLIAHIFYILAMKPEITRIYLRFVIVMSITAFSSFFLLWESLDLMKYPLLMYIGVITVMSIFAFSLALSSSAWPNLLVAPAALLLLVSASCLAINRFVSPFPYSGIIIMISYYTAQGLFAWSACEKAKKISLLEEKSAIKATSS
jgi:uncharacterized membrane protein YhhN